MFKINREVKTRPEVKEKIIFTDEDLDKVLKGLKNKNSNFRTAIFLLVYTGLRPSDILNISDVNIDLKNRVLRYYSPKRKKYREVAFHEKLVTVLRKRIKEVGKGRLFNYIDVDNLARAIKRYFQDLEIDGKQYTARTFRKTFISLCRSRYDIDASVVMELVGHEHTWFAASLGMGVKVPISRRLGARFQGRLLVPFLAAGGIMTIAPPASSAYISSVVVVWGDFSGGLSFCF